MADTKITNLAAASAAVAGHEFPSNNAGVDEKVTAAQLKTFSNNAPVFAAGTSSANTHPKFTSGTLLTTAEDGAVEFDGTAFYLTTDDGNRGVVPALNLIRQDAARTLTSSVAEQKIFDSVTNGTLTLEVGTYLFQCQVVITGLSTTSGNGAFDILGAGTATLGTILYESIGRDGATNTASGPTGSTNTNAQSPVSQQTAGTSATWTFTNIGTFEVTVAGTIIPSVTLVTAAAGTVAAGSYFYCHRIGSTTLTAIGQWS